MVDFNQYQFGFIGLGLIGGSIAKAIRQYWPSAEIIAYNPSPDTLRLAMEEGVVNRGFCRDDGDLDGSYFESSDIVFLCAPVQHNAQNLNAIKGHLKEGAILTDIGSTKRDILEHVEKAGLSYCFVGGHPMTGSNRTRYRNAEATLLENAYYIVAPAGDVPEESADTMEELVKSMHSIPIRISCAFHDYAVAGISHLPHVVSGALVNLIRDSDKDNIMHTLAAGGFRDITRISSSSAVMWEQICMTNTDNIVNLLDDYIDALGDIRTSIANKDPDRVYAFFDGAREYRDSFDVPTSGAKNLLRLLYIDIEDHPGTLAEVVSVLAVNGINIKNIGITHNRMFQRGSLRVEFYSEEERIKAKELLTYRHYVVTE